MCILCSASHFTSERASKQVSACARVPIIDIDVSRVLFIFIFQFIFSLIRHQHHNFMEISIKHFTKPYQVHRHTTKITYELNFDDEKKALQLTSHLVFTSMSATPQI